MTTNCPHKLPLEEKCGRCVSEGMACESDRSRSITISLPWPVSANRYWRSFVPRGGSRAITVVSDEAKNYKQEVAWCLVGAGVRQPIIGRVELHIKLYPKRPLDWKKRMQRDPEFWDDTVQCIDLDNANKVLLDALKGVAIEDDKWVRKITSERMEPDGEQRVVVTICQMSSVSPQLAILESAR